MQPAHTNYASAWAEYRKRRRLTYLIPGILLLGSLEGDKLSKNLPLALFVGALAAWGILNRWYENWLCPSCRHKFVEKFSPSGDRHCAQCGLSKWAESSPQPGPQNIR